MPALRSLTQPFLELLHGLERCLVSGAVGLLGVFAGLLGGWWIYVPIHELLHAAGCELGGGRVSRLEISPLYGGALLERWFDFVEVGGEYAGRLAGFDTGGSDATHLMTTGLPFALTLFPGVWLMRRGARRASPFVYGLGLAPAAGPFLSLTGDAYEIGSLWVTQLVPWSADPVRALVVGDDLFLVASTIVGAPTPATWTGLALAVVVGCAWALGTYVIGGAVATRLGEPAVEPLPRRERGSSSGADGPAVASRARKERSGVLGGGRSSRPAAGRS